MADLTTMIFDGWSKIIDLFGGLSLEGLKDFGKNLPGFVGDITGLSTVGEGD